MGAEAPRQLPGGIFVTGRAALVAFGGAVPVALWPGWTTLFSVWGVWTFLIAVDVLLAARPSLLEVRRASPRPVVVREPTSAALQVTNRGSRYARGLLRDAWPPSAGAEPNRHRLALPPGETLGFSTPLLPTRRGHLEGDRITIRCLGPLGLSGRQGSQIVPVSLRVLPRFDSCKHLPGITRRLSLIDGQSLVRRVGSGMEFDSLREYVPGDDVRFIDWTASARRRVPVVRTFRPERRRRIVIVIDSSRSSATRIGDQPRLDACLDATQLLVSVAARAGDIVDVVAADQRTQTQLLGFAKSTSLHNLSLALSEVDARLVEADWDRIAATITGRSSQAALIVLLTPLTAATGDPLIHLVERLSQRHQVLIGSVADPVVSTTAQLRGNSSELYLAASAEQELAQIAQLSDDLTALGAHVIEAGPEDLSLAVVDAYVALKASARL